MGQVSKDSATPSEAAAFFASQAAFYTEPAAVLADLRAGAKDFIILDARHEAAFVATHLPGAQHLPPEAIDAATAAHFLPDSGRLIVCYDDATNLVAAQAAARLGALGYRVKVMLGGMKAWRAADYRIEGVRA